MNDEDLGVSFCDILVDDFSELSNTTTFCCETDFLDKGVMRYTKSL